MNILKNKRLLAIIASVLALIIVVLSVVLVLAKCDGDKKKPQQVVVVVRPDDDDDTSSEPEDEDSYKNDDITLDLEYDEVYDFDIDEVLEGDSDGYVLNVHNDKDPVCTSCRGITGTVYMPAQFMERGEPHGRYYTDEMIDVEFTRLKNAGIKYLRTCFWSNWMWTGDESNPWDTENETMQGFYNFCKKADEYGMKVIPMMFWSYPSLFYGGNEYLSEVDYLMPRELDKDGNVIIDYNFGQYYERMDYEEQNRRCADWLITATKAIKAHGVTNLFGYYFGNEPHEDGGTATGAFAKWQAATFSYCEEQLRKEGFREKGSKDYITLIGPNQSAPSGRAGLARYFMENEPQVFDIYGSHYTAKGQSSTDDVYDDAKKVFEGYMEVMDLFDLRYEKEFWEDEMGSNGDHTNEEADIDDPWYPVQLATQYVALFNSGMSAISLWQFADMQWPDYYGSGGEYEYGVQRSGAMPALYNDEVPWSLYYTITLFSKFSGDQNGKTFAGEAEDDSSGLYVTAIQLEDGGWSIYVVNMTTDTRKINLKFGKALDTTLYRYLYEAGDSNRSSAANIITADKGFTNVQYELTDTLAGGSVACYSTIEYFSN